MNRDVIDLNINISISSFYIFIYLYLYIFIYHRKFFKCKTKQSKAADKFHKPPPLLPLPHIEQTSFSFSLSGIVSFVVHWYRCSSSFRSSSLVLAWPKLTALSKKTIITVVIACLCIHGNKSRDFIVISSFVLSTPHSVCCW